MPVDLDGLRLRGLVWNLARARARCMGLRRAGGRLVVRRAVVRRRLVRRVFMLFPFGLITIRAAGPGLATFTRTIFAILYCGFIALVRAAIHATSKALALPARMCSWQFPRRNGSPAAPAWHYPMKSSNSAKT